MIAEFTSLEKQLIRSSLTSKTDAEIALLLERSIEDVHQMINIITGGLALQRSEKIQSEKESAIQKYKELQLKKKRKEEEARLKKQKKDEDAAKRKKRARSIADEELRQKKKKEWELKRSYKTRSVDYSQMKSVKVGSNTYIMIPVGSDAQEAIRKYNAYLNSRPGYIKKIESQQAVN